MKTYKIELTKPELTQLFHLLMDVKPRIQRNINSSYNGTNPMWIKKIIVIKNILTKINNTIDYKLKDKISKSFC